MPPERYSWGRAMTTAQPTAAVRWRDLPLDLDSGKHFPTWLPHGKGRSYGDSCLNSEGALLLTPGLDRLIAFDPVGGTLRCEAGVTLSQILSFIVPRGFFLPVTPGTQWVTLGGAIANDVHGKNHPTAGTFGRWVTRLELLRSDGSRRECSPEKENAWFRATLGGLGLTGLITWAEIRLIPIASGWMDTETFRFDHFDEFVSLGSDSPEKYPYQVAWIDCSAKGASLGRGLYSRGSHAEASLQSTRPCPVPTYFNFPIEAPAGLINRFTTQLFNQAYFHRQHRKNRRARISYFSFFYPLDVIHNWNLVYGPRGFFQYQCVVPRLEVARRILNEVERSNQVCALAVMKTFGDLVSPGLLSFPRKGITLAMDFPNHGASTLRSFDRLDAIVRESEGALYPAKDARMSAETFRASYPDWEAFVPFIDPRFSSDFWRRVTGKSEGTAR